MKTIGMTGKKQSQEAKIKIELNFQNSNTISNVINQTKGITLIAGHFKNIINNTNTIKGINAIIVSISNHP